MQLSIKRATPGDLDVVLSLYYSFYKELRERQGLPLRGIDEYRGDVEGYLKRDAIFVALIGGEPVGFTRVSERDGSHWVEELYVIPKYRGRGIGRRLVRAAEDYVRGKDLALYVMVLPQDRPAIEFWLHVGYNILNTVELVKELRPTPKEDTRVFELFGYPTLIWRWEREDYSGLEEGFLRALKEFYEGGGTRETYLEVVTGALKEWVEKSKQH